MLLWQLHSELSDNVLGIALKSSVEGTITIYNDKSEGRLTDEEFLLEFVEIEARLTAVLGEVDGLKRLEIADEFLFSGRVLIHDPSS